MALKPEIVAKIIELGKAGHTYMEIANKFDLALETVGRYLRKAGISNSPYRQRVRGRQQYSGAERDELIRKLWKEGLSAPQIKERTGVSSVCSTLSRLGLTSRVAPRVTYNGSVSGGSGARNMAANFARRT